MGHPTSFSWRYWSRITALTL